LLAETFAKVVVEWHAWSGASAFCSRDQLQQQTNATDECVQVHSCTMDDEEGHQRTEVRTSARRRPPRAVWSFEWISGLFPAVVVHLLLAWAVRVFDFIVVPLALQRSTAQGAAYVTCDPPHPMHLHSSLCSTLALFLPSHFACAPVRVTCSPWTHE
jgi:hypothetical protein